MRLRPPSGARRSADGFTLIEVLVAMLVFGMLAAFGTSGWLHYQRAQELRRSVDELTATMRNAEEQALAEAVTYCITFSSDQRTYTTYKYGCGASGTQVGAPQTTVSDRVTISSAAFTQADGTTAAQVLFTPRGSATPGHVSLQRQGSAGLNTINVEGLTGRVSVA